MGAHPTSNFSALGPLKLTPFDHPERKEKSPLHVHHGSLQPQLPWLAATVVEGGHLSCMTTTAFG